MGVDYGDVLGPVAGRGGGIYECEDEGGERRERRGAPMVGLAFAGLVDDVADDGGDPDCVEAHALDVV